MITQNPKFRSAAVLAFTALALLGGCRDDGAQPALSLDEARKETANFSAAPLVAPPRTIGDITKILDQQKRTDQVAEKQDTEKANAPAPATAGREDLAEFYLERGRAARRIGRVGQALADLKKAYSLSDALPPEKRHVILGNLFGVESRAGRLADAIRHADEALAQVNRRKPMRVVALLTLLARSHARSGDLPAAERTLAEATKIIDKIRSRTNRRAQRIWQKWGDAMTARIKQSHAQIFDYSGKYREAEKNHRAAIALTESGEGKIGSATGNTGQIALTLRANLSRNLLAQGRLVEAEIGFREVLLSALRQEGRYSPNTAVMAAGLTAVLTAQGRDIEAEALALAGIEILEKTGADPASRAVIKTHLQLAKSLIAQTRWKDALERFDTVSKALAGDPKEHAKRLARNPIFALTLIRNDRAGEALDVARAAYRERKGRMGGKHQITAMAQGVFAMALLETGDRKAALTEFAAAVPILMQKSRRSDDGQKHQRSRIAKWIIESYMEALAHSKPADIKHAGGGDSVSVAFRLADFLRGQAVQKALAASAARAAAKDPNLADLVRKEQDSLSRIGALNALLARVVGLPDGQRNSGAVKDLRVRIDRLRGARAALAQEIAKKFPDYAALVSTRPGGVKATQAALAPGEAMISTYVSENRTFIWAVPHRGAAMFTVAPLGADRVSAMVNKLRRAVEPRSATLGGIPQFDTALSHKLYKALLAPVARGWKPAKSLLVIAHGPLGALPFSVLVTKPVTLNDARKPLFAMYRDVPWLVRDHAVTVLPSAASLATLRRLPAPRKRRREFIGFGDPVFNRLQAAQSKSESTYQPATANDSAMATRGVPVRLRSAPAVRDLAKADITSLPRLADTGPEIKSIAAALKADQARDIFLGRRANETEVKKLSRVGNLSGYRVIAFATHGLVPGDLDGLNQPALALSAPEVVGASEDGLLTMGEILTLKLDADWVVLSACNTAAASGAGAEAVSGLGKAFFYAGTRALLATNWPVETTSARALTTDLFRRQSAGSDIGRAEALRRTMLSLIDEKGRVDHKGRVVFSYAHPIFWAPFSLIGDG